jgi:SAM-dependent methyltransferase
MEDIYNNGDYLKNTQTWHTEDSPWKADQILKIMAKNHLSPKSVAEIGCGAGGILHELSRKDQLRTTQFSGYDISPQAIKLANKQTSNRVTFHNEDLFASICQDTFDVLLVIDVFEHVPDYMGFLQKCKVKAEYKIFHIPLEIHVSSALRDTFNKPRYAIGHIHYFSAESALATLRDTGHEVVDHCYTNSAIDLFRHHPSIKRAAANIPRWLFSKFSPKIASRVWGGFSLLVVTK